jgi:hypothetical protein
VLYNSIIHINSSLKCQDIKSVDIEPLITSKLKNSFISAGLLEKIFYSEGEVRSALLDFIESLYDISSFVCRPFNCFALLCALQHYLPQHIIKPRPGYESDAQLLFNNAAIIAFRFSSPIGEAKFKLDRTDYTRIADANDFSWLENYSEAIMQIYHIVSVIDFTLKNLRVLGKGAKIILDLSASDVFTMIRVELSSELDRRLREYDERVINNQNILLKQAIPLGFIKPEGPLKGVVVNPNWGQFRKDETSPSPVPVVFGMDAIYTFASLHADEIMHIFNKRVHVEDLFICIAALFKPLVEDANNNRRFAGQGYSFVSSQHLVDYVSGWAPKIYLECFNEQVFEEGTPFVLESLSPNYWKEVVPFMLRFIAHDYSSRDSIDCTLFDPAKFVYICDDDTIFIHLGSVAHFFMHFLDQFQKSGHFGAIKGRALESLLLSTIESIAGFQRVWEPGHKIQYQVLGKSGTDIDVFVLKGNLGILISCKSYGINREYELGSGQECWERSELAKGALRFAYETAKVVADHSKELSLPRGIKGILPLVCTGWPEYLFEPLEDFTMFDGTPRIATIKEIQQFCSKIDNTVLQSMYSDPWMVICDKQP